MDGALVGKLVLKSRHRLLCGDSTNAEDVNRAVDRRGADLCFTSPPYNAGDNRLGGNKSRVDSKYVGNKDDKSEQEYFDLLRAFTGLSLAVCKAAVVNIQQLAGNKRAVLQWMSDAAPQFVDMAIWAKDSAPPQMAPNVLNSEHELLVIFSALPSASRAVPFANWHGDVGTLYRGAGQKDRAVAKLHAATMPTHLPLWVMQVLCPKARTIFDPFMGSGTTLVAAEQVGRACCGIDREPVYVDVTCRRFAALSGQEAVLESTGQTWTQTAKQRGVSVG